MQQEYVTAIRKRTRNGRVEWIARLIYKDVGTGRQREKTKCVSSRSEAAKKLKKLEADFLAGGQASVEASGMTFFALADHCQKTRYCEARFNDDGQMTCGVRDTSIYKAHFKHFRDFFGPSKKVRDINVAALRAYRVHRLDTDTKRGKLNVATVDREMNTLRAVLNEAMVNDWLVVNPFSKVRAGELITISEQEAPEIILSADEERRLLKACEGPHRRHLRALVIVALDTGARQGELFRLVKSSLDFEAGIIRGLTSFKGRRGKVRKRNVPMTARVQDVLLDLLANKPVKTFRKSTISGEKPSEDLVFGISETVKTSWHRARTEAGLLHVTFNVLRHTAATRLGESTQLGIVGKVLGHSNPKTTWRYFNPDDEQIGQAGTILEEWQRNHPPPASAEVEIANESEAVN